MHIRDTAITDLSQILCEINQITDVKGLSNSVTHPSCAGMFFIFKVYYLLKHSLTEDSANKQKKSLNYFLAHFRELHERILLNHIWITMTFICIVSDCEPCSWIHIQSSDGARLHPPHPTLQYLLHIKCGMKSTLQLFKSTKMIKCNPPKWVVDHLIAWTRHYIVLHSCPVPRLANSQIILINFPSVRLIGYKIDLCVLRKSK